MGFQTPQDIVDSFHEMTTSILNTIELAKKGKRLELNMIFELEQKALFYNDTYLSFSDLITALKKDTHSIKSYFPFFSSSSKITSQKDLKPQLKTILNSIKSIIPKIVKEYGNVLDYIKTNKQFDISPSSVINMFHVLINYARDTHMFNTIELIDGVWPDLRQKIITRSIDVANYLNSPSPLRNTRRNILRNIPRNIPKPIISQNDTQKVYPFGASSTRKRRRI